MGVVKNPSCANARVLSEMTALQAGINIERLSAQLDAINSINRKSDGSCCRLALTDADKAARDLVSQWMKEAGLVVQVDQIGNIIGVEAGNEARPVITGSHIDTVATGGRYDGTFGVLAGLEVVRTLRESGVTCKRPLGVAVFTNEEGVRFQPDMMGSLVYSGGLPLEAALSARAEDGAVLGDELRRIGYAGDMPCGGIVPHAFVELHIEQGPVLDREGGVFGAVENLQGILWLEVTIRGVSNHAGTTPINMRRDAGHCAAQVILFVRELAQNMGGTQIGTIGSIKFVPNLVNVIPREAKLTIDLRNTDDELLEHAARALTVFLEKLAKNENVAIQTRTMVRTDPVTFAPHIVETVEAVARRMQQPVRRMTSGAGHDAQMMARICAAGMIFVPSIDGISHNAAEDTKIEHLKLGADALLQTMYLLANS